MFQITEDSQNVFSVDIAVDQMDDVSRSLYGHLCAILQQRDGYIEVSIVVPLVYNPKHFKTTLIIRPPVFFCPQIQFVCYYTFIIRPTAI